jgi:ApbE superfamily uncharacterized protein (UPF0280 family)
MPNDEPSIETRLAEVAERGDAMRVAHRIGGLIANDGAMREAIATALANTVDRSPAQRVLEAVAQELLNGHSDIK